MASNIESNNLLSSLFSVFPMLKCLSSLICRKSHFISFDAMLLLWQNRKFLINVRNSTEIIEYELLIQFSICQYTSIHANSLRSLRLIVLANIYHNIYEIVGPQFVGNFFDTSVRKDHGFIYSLFSR